MSTNIPGGPVDHSPIEPAHRKKKKRKRWLLRFIGIGLSALLIVSGLTVGGAEYYTSRPNFCGTCHIMDPYYVSWSKDKHGAKLDVWCVECHYAPGKQHTVMAKFKGLSQLTSYFSGRSGASRPRAHVDDASCMRAKCHGDGEHSNKILMIGERRMEKRIIAGFETQVQRIPTVHFVHSKHVDVGNRLKETDQAIFDITERLRGKTPDETFAQLQEASRSVKPAVDREARIKLLLEQWHQTDDTADALEWQRLEHIRLRLKQLEGLTCAACHTYEARGARHFLVDQQTCFVCHFTNQRFNRDTGECLRCHEPPARKFAVHSQPHEQNTQPAAVLMDHQDIVNRGINCASCHLDVVQGGTQVSERECAHCHDQHRYAEDFARRDVNVVETYHRIHVALQRARCPDCHRTIEHRLIDAEHVGMNAGFLQPVLQDCQHCHPNHHREQVELLMGTGGSGVTTAMPNAMFGSRMNCRACHTQPGTDFKGDPLIEATKESCVACHGDDYRRMFDQWIKEMQTALKEVEETLGRAESRMKELKEKGQPPSQDIAQRIDRAKENLHFVKSGNGIHNKNYALRLLEVSQRELDGAITTMSAP